MRRKLRRFGESWSKKRQDHQGRRKMKLGERLGHIDQNRERKALILLEDGFDRDILLVIQARLRYNVPTVTAYMVVTMHGYEYSRSLPNP
jgi:hypothetical protein